MWRQRARALSFGSDAARYDRARPGYPPELIDDLMATAPRRVLDIGCGTGKAGRLLAGRGCQVLGVEPDGRMAEVARAHGIDVEIAPFERWDPQDRTFDLAVSGQAWHWIEPVAGLAKVASVVPGGGSLAVFWNRASYDDDTAAGLAHIYARIAPDITDHSVVVGTVPDRQLGHQLQVIGASPAFGPPVETHYRWQQDYDVTAFADMLGTHSDHTRLPASRRDALIGEVRRFIVARGGRITVHYRTRRLTAVRRA